MKPFRASNSAQLTLHIDEDLPEAPLALGRLHLDLIPEASPVEIGLADRPAPHGVHGRPAVLQELSDQSSADGPGGPGHHAAPGEHAPASRLLLSDFDVRLGKLLLFGGFDRLLLL